MRKILVFFAVVYTLILSLNYIIGVIQTPSWLVFLGSVHYPVDYFYYLSLFAQGATRWVTSVDLYTTDFPHAMLLGFTNVFTGRLLSLLGFGPIVSYQIALTINTFVFLLLVIYYLEKLYPSHKPARLMAFILFCVANTFQGSASFYANTAEPLVRMARVPHKMLALICMILPMYLISKLQDKKPLLNNKFITYGIVALCGIIVSNINPVQWLLVSGVLFLGTFFSQRKITPAPLIFALSGFPMALYLVNLFKIPPFSQSTAWESLQQIGLTPLAFIQSFGPVVLLGIIGLPVYIRKLTLPRVFMMLYFVLSLGLFLSPVSTLTHSSNTRYLSAITILAAAIFATDFLITIPIQNKRLRLMVVWSIVFGLVFYLTPVFIAQYKKNANLNMNNAFIYISTEVYTAFTETKKLTKDSDVILVSWPYDGSFPALTGRRGYMGNPDQTINPDYKIQQAYYFFDAKFTDEEMHSFLTKNGITYVLSFSGNTKIVKPFLTPTYKNATLTLYKVLP